MRGTFCQRCAWFLMVVVAASLGSAESAGIEAEGPEAIWLIDDFEDGSLDGWLDGGGTCNYFITSSPAPPDGIRSLDIFGSCGGHFLGPYISLAGFQAGTFSIYVRANFVDQFNNYVVLDDDTLWNNGSVVFFYGMSNGTFTVSDHNGLNYSCGPRAGNEWYLVRFEIDWIFHAYDVYIDNQLQQTGVPFPIAINTLNWLYLYNLGDGHTLYDYIIASTPPPTPVLFVDGFESGDWAAWSAVVP